jgi:2-polyprenyl-6-methoxyphenol hydroxylase-like FAD-dependent oxidoreductase
MSIVIVGAGQAAASFALSLRRGGCKDEIRTEIADRSPVHRDLSAEISINTRERAAA